jgi:hypothetical protein
MTDRIARSAGALIVALALSAAPAAASVHHHAKHPAASSAHRPAQHSRHASKTAHHRAKPAHRDARPAHRDAAPSGASRVPPGGIKLFCGARSNPLLIRKSTQGAGTTVTVVCR